jgi:hypothetical protein
MNIPSIPYSGCAYNLRQAKLNSSTSFGALQFSEVTSQDQRALNHACRETGCSIKKTNSPTVFVALTEYNSGEENAAKAVIEDIRSKKLVNQGLVVESIPNDKAEKILHRSEINQPKIIERFWGDA